MRKILAAAAVACLTAGMLVGGAGAASAVTVPGDPCNEIDYSGTVGTTFVFTFANCSFEGWATMDYDGDPTVVYSAGGGEDGQPLIWYQSVGRTGDNCADGWTASYAEWPNGGKGGPTCDKSIVWGTGPGTSGAATLAVTINTPLDWIELYTDGGNYVTGCDNGDDWFADHVIIGCAS